MSARKQRRADSDEISSSDEVLNEFSAPAKRKKFTRVKQACLRCKSRKQKCDHVRPSCSNCVRANADCEWDQKGTGAGDHREGPGYADNLENRVRELETLLKQGVPSCSNSARQLVVGYSPYTEGTLHREQDDQSLTAATLSHNHLRYANPHFRDIAGRDGTSTSPFSPKNPNAPRKLLPHPIRKTPLPPRHTAIELANAFFANRWPNYPIFMPHQFRTTTLDSVLSGNPHASEATFFLVYMVFAIASIDKQVQGNGDIAAKYYYTATTTYLESALCEDDLTSIQALLLLGIYAMSDPRGVSLWHVSGVIMRLCVDFGLHRVTSRGQEADVITAELQRRIFWSAFAMEASVAVALGRPMSISIDDITTDLPCMINDLSDPAPCISSGLPDIAAFVHTMTLRGHNSTILSALYRSPTPPSLVLCTMKSSMTPKEADDWRLALRSKLDLWLRTYPQFDAPGTSTYKSHDWFKIAYCHSLLILYRPTAQYASPSDETLQICLDASMGLISAYLRLYTQSQVTFTWVALHSLFMATTTAHFVLQQSRTIRDSTTHDIVKLNMRGCSTVLGAMSSQWPAAKQCQSTAEALTVRTLELFTDDATDPAFSTTLFPLQSSSRWTASVPTATPTATTTFAEFPQTSYFTDISSDLSAWLYANEPAEQNGTQNGLPAPGAGDTDDDFDSLMARLLAGTEPVMKLPDGVNQNITAADLDFLLWTQPPVVSGSLQQ